MHPLSSAHEVRASAGINVAALILAAIGALGVIAVLVIWPVRDTQDLSHSHPDLPPDHPHLSDTGAHHKHAFVIDDLHRRWPRAA